MVATVVTFLTDTWNTGRLEFLIDWDDLVLIWSKEKGFVKGMQKYYQDPWRPGQWARSWQGAPVYSDVPMDVLRLCINTHIRRTISTAVTFFRNLGLQHPSEYQKKIEFHIFVSVKNWMWYSISTWLGPFGAQISTALCTWPLLLLLGHLLLLIHFISSKSWEADTDFCKVMFQSHYEPTRHSSILSLEKHVI